MNAQDDSRFVSLAGMAVRRVGTLLGVPSVVSAVELGSWSGLIGLINFGVKCTGARSAGNPHAMCDVAGGLESGSGFG